MRRFRIVYTLDVVLSESQIWPDGDGPENPTASAVEDLIESEGGIIKVIDEWSLDTASAYHYEVTEMGPAPEVGR